ncbi:integrin alpha-X-like [Ailuropoda melanoleuca]|uniref:integrin alpha-X-like n=1 Tax=Ailuropoda melanoleuca TaxID=9646 RepID=UPI001494257E|nr:integrin alpha-X-like [Ailuropoda melanoleuca]
MTVAEITFNRSVYSQLPGQEAFLRTQIEMVLEKYEVYNPIPVIVGSSVGGLLLLALITAILYKVGFFKRQYKEMMVEASGQTVPEDGTSGPQVAQEETTSYCPLDLLSSERFPGPLTPT